MSKKYVDYQGLAYFKQMLEKEKNFLTEDITINGDFGNYKVGDIIAEGTPIEEILSNLFAKQSKVQWQEMGQGVK